MVLRRLSRQETRRVAELQLQIKVINFQILGSSTALAISELRSKREEAQTELNSIAERSTDPSLSDAFEQRRCVESADATPGVDRSTTGKPSGRTVN